MITKICRRNSLVLIGVALSLLVGFIPTLIARAVPAFDDPGFVITWNRADLPVEQLGGQLGRGYTWGPAVNEAKGVISEPYNSTTRNVQYFDKARMEVNNAQADPANPFYVTTGLLVKELVTGSRQDGDNSFTVLAPSTVQVAGDSNLDGSTNQFAPTYDSFRGVGTFATTENGQPARPGQAIAASIDKAGTVTTLNSPPEQRLTRGYDAITHHNVADVFVDFMKQTGLVWNGRQLAQDQVIDGLYVMGRPLTEPYWIKAVVAGSERDVLVQLFERRVLTYTLANPTAYRVEMGNVGQHYWAWRYIEHANRVPGDLIPATSNQPNSAFNQSGAIPIGGEANIQLYKVSKVSWLGLSQDGKIALTHDNTNLLALNLGDDGRVAGERWRLANLDWSAQPLIYKDKAYLPTNANTVVAVNLIEGKVKWTYQLPQFFKSFGQAITDGNYLYFIASDRGTLEVEHPDGRLFALRLSDGKLAWQTPSVRASTGPSFAFGGNILFSSDTGNFYVYTRQGQPVIGWPVASPFTAYAYDNGLLYVLDGTHANLQAVDAKGKVVKSARLPSDVLIQPSISATGGRIYLVTTPSTTADDFTDLIIGLSQSDLKSVEFSHKLSGRVDGGLVIVDDYMYLAEEFPTPILDNPSEKQIVQVSIKDPDNVHTLLSYTDVGSQLAIPIVNRGRVYTHPLNSGFDSVLYVIN